MFPSKTQLNPIINQLMLCAATTDSATNASFQTRWKPLGKCYSSVPSQIQLHITFWATNSSTSSTLKRRDIFQQTRLTMGKIQNVTSELMKEKKKMRKNPFSQYGRSKCLRTSLEGRKSLYLPNQPIRKLERSYISLIN
jgi:hypothetical protein